MDVKTYAPAAELADVVETFWVGRWRLRGQAAHESELLADPCMHLTFERSDTNSGQRVVGVWTKLWRRTLAGEGRVHGIKLKAGAARSFIDTPLNRFTDRIVAFDSVFTNAEAVEAEVSQTDDDERIFATVATWLESIRTHRDDIRSAIELVERIRVDQEIMTVDRLSAAVDISVRGLQRLFRDFVGVPPKWVIRRNRLQEVALRLERGDARTLADLAAALGYADQAHLARDFKSAVGKSPSAFLQSP